MEHSIGLLLGKQTNMLKRMLSPEAIVGMKSNHVALYKPRKLVCITKESLGMKVLVSGSTMWDNSVIIVDYETNIVRQINKQGSILDDFPLEDSFGTVRCAEIHGDSLYIAQDKGITRIIDVHQDRNEIKKYRIEMGEIMKICVVSHTMILYTDQNAGKLYKFNPYEGCTQVMLKGLNKPSYITLMANDTEVKYIVTIAGGYCLQVYDSKWQNLFSIGKGTEGSDDGSFSSPNDSVCIEAGILVADGGNHRVCLFSFSGQFLRHYLTASDGLKFPKALVFKSPFLWIICQYRVFCFKTKVE